MKIQKFKKRIGLIGFGCVGQGLYDVVESNRQQGLEIGRICVKDKDKPRTLPAAAFTYNVQDLLQDESLDILAELISDPAEALSIVRQALQQGKTIVSANKKMIAENLPELIRLQQQYGGVLLYEASVCGSIPILRTLEAYYGTEPLHEVRGIVNGSSNYILSKLHNEKGSYRDALLQAQALGFAEEDPALDVEGIDALHKLCIIAAHAYGILVHPSQVLHFGIQHISSEAVALATSLHTKVKLVASIKKGRTSEVALQVLPTLVPAADALFQVDAEFNGIEIEAQFAGSQFLKGRGAGSHPTGSAVWADINAAVRGYHYTYPKLCIAEAKVGVPADTVTLLVQGLPEKLSTVLHKLQPLTMYNLSLPGQFLIQTSLHTLWQQQEALKQAGAFVAHIPDSVSLAHIQQQVAVADIALA